MMTNPVAQLIRSVASVRLSSSAGVNASAGRRGAVLALYPASCLALCGALLLTSCAAPVGVERVGARTVQRALAQSVLTTKNFSAETQNALRFADLEEQVEDHPEETIAEIHRILVENVLRGEPVSRRALIALAEVSFKHATDSGQRRY